MMQHPQPMFDLLMTLAPDEQDIAETLLLDWPVYSDTAKPGDDISNHPEIWESMDPQDELLAVTAETAVGIYRVEDGFNLNAVAIGLGLENLDYDPETFPALAYYSASPEATVLCWHSGLVLSLMDSGNDPSEGVTAFLHRLNDLGLTEIAIEQATIHTGNVSEVLENTPSV
jgi:hypothetical protein